MRPIRPAFLVVIIALLASLMARPASAAPPTPANLPPGIEALQPFVGQSICSDVAKPGVSSFSNLVMDSYPGTGSLGIRRDCGEGGPSEHKEGRAWDWMVNYSNLTQRAQVEDLLGSSDLTGNKGWLLKTDASGNRAAMARRLGIMYMIWNNKIWKAYQIDRGWQPYDGPSAHTDHVHFSFGWNGAKRATSYWTGTVAPVDYGPSGRTPLATVRSPANIKIIATYGSTTLQEGSTGEAVKVMQTGLNINPDGSFGPITKSAVSTFQSDQKLTPTGIFGPTEWKRLFPFPLNPFGALERIDPSLGKTVVTGWAIDSDVPGTSDVPLKIHIYVDGKIFAVTTEDQQRPDIAAAYPGYPAPHGFRWSGALADGPHDVCAYAINVSGTPGVNPKLGCLKTLVQHSPLGKLDSAVQGPTGTLATGWSIDPDVVDSVKVSLTLDGVALPGPVTANASRPDLLSRYRDYGDKHGFVVPISTTQGTHEVCATALNVTGTAGGNTSLGCRPLVVQHDPVAIADPPATVPGSVVVSGRALDPDTAATTSVHVYVDGAFKLAIPANKTTTALPTYPAYGAGHGYSTALALTQGPHKICTYALNAPNTPGGHRLISCQTVNVNHNAIGRFDTFAQQGAVGIPVRGWALDPDSAQPVTVQISVDGKRLADLTANADRPDIGRAYPGFGAAHGFGTTLTLGDGQHEVCLTFVNLSGTPGSNSAPTCRSLVVRHSPLGVAPALLRQPGGVVVSGWALDLDSYSPISVRVVVDGVKVAELPASSSRADVAALYPGHGADHGFTTPPLPMSEGTRNVCIVGLNTVNTPGVTTPLGCTTIAVSSGVVGAITKTDKWSDRIAFYGWALDRDSSKPITVRVLLDGKEVAVMTAGLNRPELASTFPGYGTAHGWQVMLRPTRGTHAICPRADNLAGTPGVGGSLGCLRFTF